MLAFGTRFVFEDVPLIRVMLPVWEDTEKEINPVEVSSSIVRGLIVEIAIPGELDRRMTSAPNDMGAADITAIAQRKSFDFIAGLTGKSYFERTNPDARSN